MSSAFLISIIAIAVILMIFAITKLDMHPFIVLLLVTIFVGGATGISPSEIIKLMQAGFGGIMGNIGIVIIAGTIIGTILEKTGAALTMANTILKLVGKDKSVLTMSIIGYITGIPVFCDSGFIILSPISRALAEQSNKSLASMAVALSGGLYATHCLVPPTPGPLVMAGNLNADLGLLILIGLIVSIPTVAIAVIYANKIGKTVKIPAKSEYTIEELEEKFGQLPSALHSFSPILIPIILIGLKSIVNFPSLPLGQGKIFSFIDFIGNPIIALIIGIFFAISLVPSSAKSDTLSWIEEGIKNSASILAITGAGGAFGEVLKSLPIAEAVGGSLLTLGFGIFIPFIIAMLLKTAMGASTVAMIVTSTMFAPLLETMGFASSIGRVLVILAIGAGSMTVSHANDSYFWVVSQFSDMNTQEAYKTQTILTLLQGLTTILVVFILSLILL